MRVILDTNVLSGALISPYGTPDTIYRAWRAARFELVTSNVQIEELRRVSRYPKLKAILPPHRIGTMINNLHRAIILDTLPPIPEKTFRLQTPMMLFWFPCHWRLRPTTS